MNPLIIDGKQIASQCREQVRLEILREQEKDASFAPHLVVIQVGRRQDSNSYIKMKDRAAIQVGIKFSLHNLDENTASQQHLLESIQRFNGDPGVHGIIVQLPLPDGFDEAVVASHILAEKDVDGFHLTNIGALTRRDAAPHFLPCTPAAIMRLLSETRVPVCGANALVIGRSPVVGMPTALMLARADATVTIAHRSTRNLDALVRHADILVAAAGAPELVKSDWLKPGCVVIDVGMTWVPDATKASGHRWSGDVEYESALSRVAAITPVPGGVGPMTVAMLMKNTLLAAQNQKHVYSAPL